MISLSKSYFDIRQVPEISKLFAQLEELRVDVAENEKVEAEKQETLKETMMRIEKLFLEAENIN